MRLQLIAELNLARKVGKYSQFCSFAFNASTNSINKSCEKVVKSLMHFNISKENEENISWNFH